MWTMSILDEIENSIEIIETKIIIYIIIGVFAFALCFLMTSSHLRRHPYEGIEEYDNKYRKLKNIDYHPNYKIKLKNMIEEDRNVYAKESNVPEHFLTHININEIVEEEFKNLQEGHVLFNVNKEMKVGVSEEAKAYITKSLSQIQEQVESYCLDRKIDTIKISPKMKVSLTGDNFKIMRVTESVQSVLNGRLTTWEWIIKPQEAGTQKLKLNVYVIIEIPSYLDRDIHMITKKEDIEVKVNPKYLLGVHMNTIIAIAGIIVTLIVGIATVILTNK